MKENLNKILFCRESVTIGEYHRFNVTDCNEEGCLPSSQVIRVESCFNHRNYDVKDPRAFYDDIALIRLAEKITWMDHIKPICLPNIDLNVINKTMVAAGWGANNECKF